MYKLFSISNLSPKSYFFFFLALLVPFRYPIVIVIARGEDKICFFLGGGIRKKFALSILLIHYLFQSCLSTGKKCLSRCTSYLTRRVSGLFYDGQIGTLWRYILARSKELKRLLSNKAFMNFLKEFATKKIKIENECCNNVTLPYVVFYPL